MTALDMRMKPSRLAGAFPHLRKHSPYYQLLLDIQYDRQNMTSTVHQGLAAWCVTSTILLDSLESGTYKCQTITIIIIDVVISSKGNHRLASSSISDFTQ